MNSSRSFSFLQLNLGMNTGVRKRPLSCSFCSSTAWQVGSPATTRVASGAAGRVARGRGGLLRRGARSGLRGPRRRRRASPSRALWHAGPPARAAAFSSPTTAGSCSTRPFPSRRRSPSTRPRRPRSTGYGALSVRPAGRRAVRGAARDTRGRAGSLPGRAGRGAVRWRRGRGAGPGGRARTALPSARGPAPPLAGRCAGGLRRLEPPPHSASRSRPRGPRGALRAPDPGARPSDAGEAAGPRADARRLPRVGGRAARACRPSSPTPRSTPPSFRRAGPWRVFRYGRTASTGPSSKAGRSCARSGSRSFRRGSPSRPRAARPLPDANVEAGAASRRNAPAAPGDPARPGPPARSFRRDPPPARLRARERAPRAGRLAAEG